MIIKPDEIKTQKCKEIHIHLGEAKFEELYDELSKYFGKGAEDILAIIGSSGVIIND
ncbi:MAG: hypothetical protein Q8M92_01205 [Candidatus Subteraquimicrobiales bacterium]|nr:hypothetical protein [Candidatus Subteraquimicrobiales bacterium]